MATEADNADPVKVVEEAVKEVVKEEPKSEPKEEALDAKAELFVRRVTDSVLKGIADILKPTEATSVDSEDYPKRRKRKPASTPAQPTKRTSLLDRLW